MIKDDDLSDEELNDIFLSDNPEPIRSIKDPNDKTIQPDLKHLIKKKKPANKPKNAGRKKIWTDEKIKELKETKKQEAQIKRDNKKLQEQINKLTLNQGYGEAEQHRVAQHMKINKKLIEEELTNQRNLEDELNNNCLLTPKCDHIDKFSYIDPRGYIISECMQCSRKQEWDPVSWDRYWYKTKGELQCKKRN